MLRRDLFAVANLRVNIPTSQSNFLHVKNHPLGQIVHPLPGISPKWVNRLFFVIPWPVVPVDVH